EYCFTLFAVVAIALLVSWVVAVIFTPFIGSALLKEKPGSHEPAPGRIARSFRRVLLWALAHRKTVIAATAGAFVLSVVLVSFVEQQFFPSSDRRELLVSLTLAQGASIEATQAQVERLEKTLANDPDIEQWSFYVGTGAIRFYLPLNVQLENANIAQAV